MQGDGRQTFDGGAANDVSFVLSEGEHETGSAEALIAGVGNACDDQAKMPTGAVFAGWEGHEQAGELIGVGVKGLGVDLGDATGYIGGTLSGLRVVAEEGPDERTNGRG